MWEMQSMDIYMTWLAVVSCVFVIGFAARGARSFGKLGAIGGSVVSRYSRAVRWLVVGCYVGFVALTFLMMRVLDDQAGAYDRAIMALVYLFFALAVSLVVNTRLVVLDDCFVRIDFLGNRMRFHGRDVESVTVNRRNGGLYRVRLRKGGFFISRRMENVEEVVRCLRGGS